MFGTSARSGFRRGCGRASWRPPSDLVDQVHVSGALSGARTGKGRQMANPRPTPKPGNLGPPWPPGTGGDPAGYSRGRPLGGSRLSLVRSGSPGAGRRQAMNWRPIRGWTRLLHERGMKAGSMPERLLIGPGSPPSIDPVYPELSPPPEPCPGCGCFRQRNRASFVLWIFGGG